MIRSDKHVPDQGPVRKDGSAFAEIKDRMVLLRHHMHVDHVFAYLKPPWLGITSYGACTPASMIFWIISLEIMLISYLKADLSEIFLPFFIAH